MVIVAYCLLVGNRGNMLLVYTGIYLLYSPNDDFGFCCIEMFCTFLQHISLFFSHIVPLQWEYVLLL